MRIAFLAWLGVCAGLLAVPAAAAVADERAALEGERDPARLEAAAVAIARSKDAAATADLARHLGERAFLERLDPPGAAGSPVVRLARVFRALALNPSPASASLGIALAGDPDFTAVPARLNHVLSALAAVRPMSEQAARIFRATGRTQYLEVNGPLLARNGSPRALQVLEELLRDDSLDAAQRVSMAHWALLPNRTKPRVIEMSGRLVNARISRDVQVAIVESLYDYQPRRWFSVASGQPKPPPWSAAPAAARERLKSLGKTLLARSDLEPALRAAIQETLQQLG